MFGMCTYIHVCLYMGVHVRVCAYTCVRVPEAGVKSLPYTLKRGLLVDLGALGYN